jgi:hypothetical protein
MVLFSDYRDPFKTSGLRLTTADQSDYAKLGDEMTPAIHVRDFESKRSSRCYFCHAHHLPQGDCGRDSIGYDSPGDSDRAGGDRVFLTSDIRSLSGTLDFSVVVRSKNVSRFRYSTRTLSKCVCHMVTHLDETCNVECKRTGSARCVGAAVAVGKPPTPSSSEQAGGDRQIKTSGIRS